MAFRLWRCFLFLPLNPLCCQWQSENWVYRLLFKFWLKYMQRGCDWRSMCQRNMSGIQIQYNLDQHLYCGWRWHCGSFFKIVFLTPFPASTWLKSHWNMFHSQQSPGLLGTWSFCPLIGTANLIPLQKWNPLGQELPMCFLMWNHRFLRHGS